MERRLELISEVTTATSIHFVAVFLAVLIGAVVLWQKKGTRRHRLFGRVWVALMAVGATSSFWIAEINQDGLSPIHLLSAWTIISLLGGLVSIRFRRRLPNAIRWHKFFMQSLYASGILIAGAFTLLPHRLLGRLSFGEVYPGVNYAIVAVISMFGVVLLVRSTRNEG